MKALIRNISPRWFALLAAFTLVFAQGGAHAQGAYAFSQQELDQMLAPIALYPDPLLSQILMAATYPLEVVEAARWSRARPGLSGDDAVRAAEGEDWDPSVKSLLAFPQVLERMDENLQWTQTLGDAFLDQQAQVMDTVQALRRRAAEAGSLRSDDRLRVLDSGSGLMLEPLNPQTVYVPYYDPQVVYGPWWWPAYPPVYWRPWPGYYAQPGYSGGIYWGPPVGISAGFFFGAFDWPRRRVEVAQVNNYYHRSSASVSHTEIANRSPGAWHHEPEHRRGIAYRGIEAPQRFGAARAPQGQADRAGPSDPRRPHERIDLRPGVRSEARSEAQPDGRRPGNRPAAETRANPQPAPATRAAPVLRPTPPAARSAPVMPPADARFDRHREPPGPAQAARPVTGMRPVPVMQATPAAPVMHHSPAAQPAPASRGDHQAARPEQGVRHEAARPAKSAAEAPPARAAARQEAGADGTGRPRAAR